MIEAIAGLSSAFGLAGSAGLNAYIPLMVVALASRFPLADPLLKLSAPYDILSNTWAIVIIGVLLLIEMTADKIPAVDTVNDGIQTFVRPVAGAILFAGSASVITDIHPLVSLAAGLLTAGGVHATKSAVRPVVTATTVGTGNWAVSLGEDIMAFIVSMLAILVPLIAGILMLGLLILIVYLFRKRRRNRTAL